MSQFDGVGDVELFLQRFALLANYYGRSDSEWIFRIKRSIRGNAQFILMDAAEIDSVEGFNSLLKDRFGNAAHAERYRADLTQLRRGILSLQQLHIQVRTLMSKAAPGPWTALTKIYARDAFLNALGDLELRCRIMLTCPPPMTLAAAYDLALRASAFDVSAIDAGSERRHRSPTQKRNRYARVISGGSCSLPDGSSGEHGQLQEENHRLRKQIDELHVALSKISSANMAVEQLRDWPGSTRNQGTTAPLEASLAGRGP